jgi:DNA repair protein SbcC/Rad50
MQIEYMELRNIKSYEKSGRISFTEGINAISGENGAGKSTLLEAIGYTLFDSKSLKVEHFIREGEKKGEIIIGFTDSVDHRIYQVVRPVGSGQPHIYDPETRRKLVLGKADVYDWLKEHLQVSPTADLPALFSDAVGVPQGLLTAPFLEAKASRKAKFDPLLQVDEYEKAWTHLRETGSHLDKQIAEENEVIARLDGRLEQLPGLKDEAKQIAKDIAQEEKELQTLSGTIEKVEAEKKALDAAKAEVDQLKQQVEIDSNKLDSIETTITNAETAVQQAREASEIVEQSQGGNETYEAAQTQAKEMERQRQERDRLNEQLTEIDQVIALTAQRIHSLEGQLKEITASEVEMASLAPVTEKQQQLKEALRQAEAANAKWENARQRIQEEETELEKCQKKLALVDQEVEQRRELEAEMTAQDKELQACENKLPALTAEAAILRQQVSQLKERHAVLGLADTSDCPVCQKPLSEEEAKALQEQYAGEIQDCERRLDETQKDHQAAKSTSETINKALKSLRQKIDKLSHQEQKLVLADEFEAQQETLEKWQQEQAQYADGPERIVEIKQELEALGDPASRYHVLQSQAEKRPEIEKQLQEAQTSLAEQQSSKRPVETALGGFADLESRLAAVRSEIERCEPDHQHFLQNLQIAQELESRQAHLTQALGDYQEVSAKKETAEKALKKALKTYDEDTHLKVKEESQKYSKAQAAMKAALDKDEARRQQVKEQIDSLTPLQGQLADHQQEQALLEKLQEDLKFVRNTIREAGPRIIQRLVQLISEEANRIYTDIINDYTYRLSWNEEYEITLEHLGNTRDFSQLSGGEKMVAALAVRLALLREMSEIRIAFFDEPTAHLDENRRENLAEQITNIKGFQQLFVISHDDTFERQTHNILHVSKEGGVSLVQQGI